MDEIMKFGTLASVELHEAENASEPDSATWVMIDEAGRRASFIVGPKVLSLLLQLTCALVEKSATSEARVPPKEGGTSVGLPANNIEVSPGRNPKEVSLHVHLGKVHVAYMVPLDSVIIALGTLVQGLQADPPLATH